MKGKEEYELKKKSRISNLLSKNPAYLSAYNNFIGMDKSYDTRYNYCLTIIDFMKYTNKPLNKLEMDDFSAYLSNIVESKSSSYGIRAYAALKLFGEYLVSSRKLQADPMLYIKRPKYKETKEEQHKRDIGFLDKKEIQQVKYNIKHGVGNEYFRGRQEPYINRDMLIFLIFLCTGMRCSALIKIDVEDIDRENLIVSVYDKGDKINTYRLTNEVGEYFDKWLVDRQRILGEKQEDALFISRNKNRIAQGSVQKIIGKFCKNIEGKHITPHKLRATFGTQLYKATGDIYFTQKMMKHSDPRVTERYIRGKDTVNIDKAAEIMSKILG